MFFACPSHFQGNIHCLCNIYREHLSPASDYVNHLGGTKVDIIEELKALHLNGGDIPAENGDTYHEVIYAHFSFQ